MIGCALERDIIQMWRSSHAQAAIRVEYRRNDAVLNPSLIVRTTFCYLI